MKERVKQEIMQWCQQNNITGQQPIDELFEIMFEKTTNALLEDVKTEFKQEFSKGNLQHTFVISSDYYLDLKCKEIKQKWIPAFVESIE